MKQLTDRALAKAYLVHREKDYSTMYVMRGAVGLYFLQLALFGIFVAGSFVATSGPFKTLCIWGVGMAMGAFIRDAGWYRRMKAQWPLTKSFIDWPKVETIAKQRGGPDSGASFLEV